MAEKPREQLLAWLNDAYAMEQSIIQVLENHVKDAQNQPTLHTRIQQHLEETRQHADLVKGCIERLGGDTSAIKSGVANMMGRLQGMSTGMMAGGSDELVKDGIMDYSTEYFEIASYKALIAAAQRLGDTETVQVCQRILQQEEAMAQFLEQQLPMVVDQVLTSSEQAAG